MRALALLAGLMAAVAGAFLAVRRSGGDGDAGDWTTDFALEPGDLASSGRNPYFVLEPGYTLTLQDGADELIITVLDETRLVDGIETRVVEERETEGGQLVEVSRNYFAISRRTNSVYYFGEEVDIYRDGVVVEHEGAWLAGVNGARPGLMMPGLPLVGARYYQEIAPDVAMDRAEIVALDDTLDTPAGRLTHLLRTAETTPLERGAHEFKYYAPGIGLVRDESLRLVRHSAR